MRNFNANLCKESFKCDMALRGAEKASVSSVDALLANADAIVKESESLNKDMGGRLAGYSPLFKDFVNSAVENDPRLESSFKISEEDLSHIISLLRSKYTLVVLLYSLRLYEGFVELTVFEPVEDFCVKSSLRKNDGILPGGACVVSSLSLFTDTFISMLIFLSELLARCGEDCLMAHIEEAYNELKFSEEVDFKHFKTLCDLVDNGMELYCPLPNPFKFLAIDLYREFSGAYDLCTTAYNTLPISRSAKRSYAVLLDEYVNSCFKEARNIRANIKADADSIQIN